MASGQQFQIWACHYKLPAKILDVKDNPAGNLAHQLCGNVLPVPTQPLRGRAKACCHPGDKEPAVKPAWRQVRAQSHLWGAEQPWLDGMI